MTSPSRTAAVACVIAGRARLPASRLIGPSGGCPARAHPRGGPGPARSPPPARGGGPAPGGRVRREPRELAGLDAEAQRDLVEKAPRAGGALAVHPVREAPPVRVEANHLRVLAADVEHDERPAQVERRPPAATVQLGARG